MNDDLCLPHYLDITRGGGGGSLDYVFLGGSFLFAFESAKHASDEHYHISPTSLATHYPHHTIEYDQIAGSPRVVVGKRRQCIHRSDIVAVIC